MANNSWSPSKPAQTFGVLQSKPDPFQQAKKPTPTPPPRANTLDGFEVLKDMPKSIGKTVQEQGKTGLNQALESITGVDFSPSLGLKGEMKAGQAVDLATLNKQPEKKPVRIEAGIEAPHYGREVVDSGKNALIKEQQETKKDSQEILAKLHQIAASSNEMKQKLEQATGPMAPAGKQQKSRLEGLLGLFQDMRQKSDESGTWSKAQGKKNMQGKIGQPQNQKAKTTGFLGRFKPQNRSDVVNSETNAAKSG